MQAYRFGGVFLALLLCSVNALALSPDEMHEVRMQFNAGLRSEAANATSHESLQRLLESEPDNPLLLAYFGSTETLLGRYAWMPWNKLGYVNDGLAHIERALRLSGQQHGRDDTAALMARYEVQLVAANTYIALPDMFNTFDSGKRLLAGLLEAESRNDWPDEFRYSLFNAVAQAAARDGNPSAQAKWQAQANALASDKDRE